MAVDKTPPDAGAGIVGRQRGGTPENAPAPDAPAEDAALANISAHTGVRLFVGRPAAPPELRKQLEDEPWRW